LIRRTMWVNKVIFTLTSQRKPFFIVDRISLGVRPGLLLRNSPTRCSLRQEKFAEEVVLILSSISIMYRGIYLKRVWCMCISKLHQRQHGTHCQDMLVPFWEMICTTALLFIVTDPIPD